MKPLCIRLAVFSLLAADCSDSGTNSTPVQKGDAGAPAQAAPPQTATIVVQNTVLQRAIPVGVNHLRFTGLNSAGQVVWGPSFNTIWLLVNNGNGTFKTPVTYTTDSLPYSVALGDTGNKRPDVAVPNENGKVDVLFDVLFGTGGSLETADVDQNGSLDLLVAGGSDGTLWVLLNQGNLSFAPRVGWAFGMGSYMVAAGDYNGDGKVDLAKSGSSNLTTYIRR